MPLSENVRRVVTTIDTNDKAVVLMEGPIPHKKVRPQAQTVSRLIWVTDETPADLSGTSDRAGVDIGIMPPRGGSVFRIVEFPPETATAPPSAACRRGILPCTARARSITPW